MTTKHVFNLFPLPVLGGTAGSITVVCIETGKREAWNTAAAQGWVADGNGAPFKAYYSPEGLKIATERNDRQATP